MSQSLILIDVLSSACWEKKRQKQPGVFFPHGQTCLAGCAHMGCWMQLKADLRVNLLILCVFNVLAVIIWARIRITQV
jgi:hypothetical protein